MDYEKLKEYGQSIKLTDEAKAEITANCKAVQSEKRGGIMLTAAAKRTAAVLAAAAVIIAGIACVKYLKQPAPKIDNAETLSTVGSSAENSTAPSSTEIITQTEQVETTENDIGGGFIGLRKYRVRYYDIPYPFVSLIGKEAYLEWREVQPDPDVSNVMMMVNFVRDFNISREDFDRANNESAWRIKNLLDGVPVMNPQDYANQEDDEVYNADIVYTFDNELINEYYLTPDYPFLYMQEYEEAVENGTYETRTTDFVEVPAEQPMPEIPN